MGEAIIRLENVSKTFSSGQGNVEAVRNINLEIEKGDIFGIIGLSGAGKSTLVRCLNLLERPTEGRVFIGGKDITVMKPKELSILRRDIGMIFQHFNLLMQRTVLDNVTFPLEIAGESKKEARKKAVKFLETVGLAEKKEAYPAQLSGGQKQRVAIARVLASDPRILLCDEATSALDPQTTKSILELIKDINRNYGITVVIITHEMSVVQEICNKVAVLDHGNLIEKGTVEELFRSPKTEEAKKLVFSETAHIRHMHSSRQIRVVFDGKSAFEPIIGNITLELKTPVNILYANTQTINGNAEGEMILQLPDNKEIADKMVDYFKEKNLGAEEVNYVD
ncbi:MAG: ATP-binding cassette domain-containing protein [Lachnospiraceae bacterium]|nr:ATP-binding cassette domain-containing protein [Lachnospiraceae bacterium]